MPSTRSGALRGVKIVNMEMQAGIADRATVSLLPASSVLWTEALVMLVCLGMPAAGNAGNVLVGGGLTFWSLRNSTSAMQSLSLLMLLTSLNMRLPLVVFPGVLKWLVLSVALCSAIYHCLRNHHGIRNIRVPDWLLTLLLFVLVILLLSVVSSSSPELSITKLIIFAVGVCGVMAIFADPQVNLRYCLSWFSTLFTVVVVASIPLIWSAAGYLRGTQFFTGIMPHSQLFGIFLAPFIVYALLRWLYACPPISYLEKSVCLVALIMLYLTCSRTAGITVLFSLVIMLIRGYFLDVYHRRMTTRVSILAGMLALALVAVNMTSHGRLTSLLQTYLQKRGDPNKTILASRETKFTEAYHTFLGHLLSGVGFGMPVNEYDTLVVERDPILHLPLSAPVEASVMYMALPAQIGLLGLLPFLAFLLALAIPVVRSAPLPILGLSLSAFFTNFGEYAFFSFGSIGLLWWLLFALSHTCAAYEGPSREMTWVDSRESHYEGTVPTK